MRHLLIGLLVGASVWAPYGIAGPALAASESVVFPFHGVDGDGPAAELIQVSGKLYGTTFNGGTNGVGVVFSFDLKTGEERVLYSFGRRKNCGDGCNPDTGLFYAKGKLFGTTDYGGAYGQGTVFAVDVDGRAETVLHSFNNNGADGYNPSGSLIAVRGELFGMTVDGGNYGYGTIFSLDPETETEDVLYSFGKGDDGSYPFGAVLNVGGTLFGVAHLGGTYFRGYGAVFSFDPATSSEQLVYSFTGGHKDGEYPSAGLLDMGGKLYGVTQLGGGVGCGGQTYGCGTAYAFDPGDGSERKLHSFQKSDGDGYEPETGLIAENGVLYGTTFYGCAFHHGTVFSVDSTTGAESVVYSFCMQKHCADGSSPDAQLLQVGNILYGTTNEGGDARDCPKGCGAIFAISP